MLFINIIIILLNFPLFYTPFRILYFLLKVSKTENHVDRENLSINRMSRCGMNWICFAFLEPNWCFHHRADIVPVNHRNNEETGTLINCDPSSFTTECYPF